MSFVDVARRIIVVPCYNEARRLSVDAFVDHLRDDPCTVFLFVDDASTDDTAKLLEGLRRGNPERVHVHSLPTNSGKAEAVRAGMRMAVEMELEGGGRADLVGFWDADLSTPLDSIPRLADVFAERPRVEMVFGSRVLMMGRVIRRRALRHYLGRVFATFASLTLGLAIYDTQCGAKLFRVTDTLNRMLAEPFLSRWAFDVELIARFLCAQPERDGVSAEDAIYELPLPRWEHVDGSKVGPADFFRAISELWRIRRRYRSGI